MGAPLKIYTDGACSGNPGPGGWAAILLSGETEKTLSGGATQTTNNRMELTAAIMALRALTRPCTVTLYTDSKYVKNGIESWIHNWKRNGWRTANRKPVLNDDLWRALDELSQQHRISWHWVMGHNGDLHNEAVDKLAVAARDSFRKESPSAQSE